METTGKQFHLGTIVTITAGLLVAPKLMEDVYDICNYMTGDNLFTHQLPRAAREIKPLIQDQLPFTKQENFLSTCEVLDLRLQECSTQSAKAEYIADWMRLAIDWFGEYHVLTPRSGLVTHKDPITELYEMVPAEKVIVLDAKAEQEIDASWPDEV